MQCCTIGNMIKSEASCLVDDQGDCRQCCQGGCEGDGTNPSSDNDGIISVEEYRRTGSGEKIKWCNISKRTGDLFKHS